MLTFAKKKLRSLKQKTQAYAGLGARIIEEFSYKELLLRNSNFWLIHVPEDKGGSCTPMKIVIPAVDRPTRHKVREQGYFTVSHLWGPKEEWEPWTSHGIIGIDGNIVEVKIRPEKQNTLLDLIKSRPGYWWIDVFCAQSKAPPSIMGDVYRFCNRCYALVDFPSAEFSHIEAIGRSLQSLQSVDRLVEIYNERINGKMGSADMTWRESLDDLLAGWYNGDPADIQALADFFSCQWFTRVWTLQEYILPRTLTFISDTGPMGNQFDRKTLTRIIDTLRQIAAKTIKLNLPRECDKYSCELYRSVSGNLYEYVSRTPGLSRCYFDVKRFDAFSLYVWYNMLEVRKGFNLMSLRYVSSNLDYSIIVLPMLARLPRECMYPKDYIYGVCGLLDMNIPAELDDEEVWDSFRAIVQKRTPHATFPEASPLPDAKNMQDVYKMFIGMDIEVFIETFIEYFYT